METIAEEFASWNELRDLLAATDISVPSRRKRRTNFHRERWAMYRLLASLPSEDLAFPMSLTKSERPDFALKSGDQEIGVEVTEAASASYSQYATLAAREFPNAFMEPALFRYDAPRLSINEMRKLLAQDRLVTNGWSGDSAEKEWALFVRDAIARKDISAGKPGFVRYPLNWLLIYDNLPMPAIDLELATKHLRSHLAKVTSALNFDRVFVESNRMIADLTESHTRILPVDDLWPHDAGTAGAA